MNNNEFTKALAKEVMLALIKHHPVPPFREVRANGFTTLADYYANAAWSYAEAFEKAESPVNKSPSKTA